MQVTPDGDPGKRSEELLERLWSTGAIPAIAAVVRPDVLADGALLLEVVAGDARRRWEAGDPARVEDYAPHIPDLERHRDVFEQLVVVEIQHRPEDTATLGDELTRRFPRYAGSLDVLLEFRDFVVAPGRAVAHDRELDAGETHRQYRLVRLIGAGSFGQVWQALDLRLRRYVALKVLRASPDRPGGAIQQVLAEARTTAAVDHPNVVKVHAAGELDPAAGLYFIDSQLVADSAPRGDDPLAVAIGVPLTGLALARDRSGMRRRAEIVRDVALGVAAAHARGIVHRDLKPANVIVTPSGRALVTDFGLSVVGPLRSRADRGADDVTTTLQDVDGRIVGTPAFMSPEQARGEKATPLSDIYGLGASFYWMLAARPPFLPRPGSELDPIRDVIDQVRSARAVSLPNDVPSPVAAICRRALAPAPEDRYQSAALLARDLELFLDHRRTSVEPPSVRAAIARLLRRRLLEIAIAVVAGVVLLVASIAFVVRLRSERDHVRTALGEKEAALVTQAEATRARDAAHRRATLLMAPHLVQGLIRRADELWPREPDRVADLRSWLGQAEDALELIADATPELDRVRARALPYDERARLADTALRRRRYHEFFARLDALRGSVAAVDRRLDVTTSEALVEQLEVRREHLQDEIEELERDGRFTARLTWAFTDEPDRLLHQALSELDEGRRLLPGLMESVRERLDFALTITRRTLEDEAEAWRRAVAEIGDPTGSPAYAGLAITPQLGLVPLGRNADSGLHEFWHVGSGERPAWRPDGVAMEPETGLVLVLLPGARFAWATTLEPVELEPFFISKFEMTQGQWRRITGWNPSLYPAGPPQANRRVTDTNPVEQVDWETCRAVLGRLSLVLPTEAQWEYAARAGTTTRWWTGDDVSSLAGAGNLADAYAARGAEWPTDKSFDDGHLVHAPVGLYRPNPFGLYDVIGNVWEWCEDPFTLLEIPARPGDGLRWDPAAPQRIFRGGSFNDLPRFAGSGTRYQGTPGRRIANLGVRPAGRLRGR